MRRRFEATVIWPETGGRYSKEIEVELTDKENSDVDGLWKTVGEWEVFTSNLKYINDYEFGDGFSVYEKLDEELGGFVYDSWIVDCFKEEILSQEPERPQLKGEIFTQEDNGSQFKAKPGTEWDGEAFGMLTVEGQSAYIRERYGIGQALLDEFENVCHAIENGDDDREWKIFRPVEIETPLRHLSVRIWPEHILKLPFRYFTWGDGLMAFATERRDSNYVIENLLKHNLKCYGEYSILGYSRLADSGLLYGWDVYHTDLPEWRLRQGVDASRISIERLPYEDYSKVYDDEF